ncbi:hypothetical protein PV342_26410, partial [Streptomyces sp. PA03-3a]|nr:hypothetical protein [Streptomyces sp. PA03-3a]
NKGCKGGHGGGGYGGGNGGGGGGGNGGGGGGGGGGGNGGGPDTGFGGSIGMNTPETLLGASFLLAGAGGGVYMLRRRRVNGGRA